MCGDVSTVTCGIYTFYTYTRSPSCLRRSVRCNSYKPWTLIVRRLQQAALLSPWPQTPTYLALAASYDTMGRHWAYQSTWTLYQALGTTRGVDAGETLGYSLHMDRIPGPGHGDASQYLRGK